MAAGLKATDLTALVCSRLCHDLVSPVGALANGLEIVAEEEDPAILRQAVELLNHSVGQASRQLQFFRLAFGASAGTGQRVPTDDIARTLKDYLAGKNIGFDWPDAPDEIDKTALRVLANMAFVASECVMREGRVCISAPDDKALDVTVEGEGCALRDDWAAALNGTVDMSAPGVAPALLLTMLVSESGGRLVAEPGAGHVTLNARL